MIYDKEIYYYLYKDRLYKENELDLNTQKDALRVLSITYSSYDGAITVNEYEEYTEDLEIQARLKERLYEDYSETASVSLSDGIINTVSKIVERSIEKVIRNYGSYASEDEITSALATQLNDDYFINDDRVNIAFQTYSSRTKEPINGADLGFIFDLRDRYGNRVIKTILIQAKKMSSLGQNVYKLPRIKEQIRKMNHITGENYVFLYNGSSLLAVKSSDVNTKLSISSIFSQVLRCHSGDKKKKTLINALDSKRVINIDIDENVSQTN